MKYTDESGGPFHSASNPKRNPSTCAPTALYDLGHDTGAGIMEGLHNLCAIINNLAETGV